MLPPKHLSYILVQVTTCPWLPQQLYPRVLSVCPGCVHTWSISDWSWDTLVHSFKNKCSNYLDVYILVSQPHKLHPKPLNQCAEHTHDIIYADTQSTVNFVKMLHVQTEASNTFLLSHLLDRREMIQCMRLYWERFSGFLSTKVKFKNSFSASTVQV